MRIQIDSLPTVNIPGYGSDTLSIYLNRLPEKRSKAGHTPVFLHNGRPIKPTARYLDLFGSTLSATVTVDYIPADWGQPDYNPPYEDLPDHLLVLKNDLLYVHASGDF